MSFATVENVATEIGRPIPATEMPQVQQWIDRVEARIRLRVPGVDDLATEPAYRESVTGVVVAVVARKVLNPEGLRSERIDDYYADRGSTGAAELWPTQAEWEELIPASSVGAFSTRPRFDSERGPAWQLWP